ncbi:MAG: helix-turn-helix transcriptional regulator [Chloroflexi bacterium]|nr:helix-turn-helix transcriptional regulator [Chloroflexota bacterium]
MTAGDRDHPVGISLADEDIPTMAHHLETNDAATPDVGQRIRLLRETQRLSLRAVAERCGLSINAISRIERGENSPTVASLHLLATALNVPITEFFRDDADCTTIYVKREHRLRSRRVGMDIESLGIGLCNQQLEPFLVTVQPGTGVDTPPITHAGQEFTFCVEGSIEYQIGADTYALDQGDSLLFEASQPHWFRNVSSLPAVILLVFQTQEGNQSVSRSHLDT